MAILRGPAQLPAQRELTTTAISASIAANAVDVFVYDTRKDSDGGAWRKRCQHTSWYNETLNTSTRGSRREFPAVAVIVVETKKVTIYDGDDSDLPMWMVFELGTNASNETVLRYGEATSVYALNATVVFGLLDCPVELNFVSEKHVLHHAGGRYYYPSRRGIVDRNVLITEPDGYGLSNIVTTQCHDVAMTVLPGAPIDPATNLPTPTTALALDAGYSIINDDKTTTNCSLFGYNIKNVAFNKDNNLWIAIDYGVSTTCVALIALNPIDRAYAWNSKLAYIENPGWSSTHQFSRWADFNGGLAVNKNDRLVSFGVTKTRVGANNDDYGVITYNEIAGNADVGEYYNDSLASVISSSYTTGWLCGANRAAWLCDATGTSGSISSGQTTSLGEGKNILSGSYNLSTWSIQHYNNATTNATTGNGQEITNLISGDTAWKASQSGSGVISGLWYKVTFSIRTNNTYLQSGGTDTWRSYVTLGGTKTYFPAEVCTTTNDQWETRSFLALAGSTDTNYFIQFGADSPDVPAGAYVHLRSVRVQFLGEADRSANESGLQVFGTLTKTPVATGSQLLGYSGFSASNYFKQPVSNIDFNTKDFYIMGWIKATTPANNGVIFQYANPSSLNNQIIVDTRTANGTMAFYTTNNNYSTYDQVFSEVPVTSNTWRFFVAVKNGKYLRFYVDGLALGEVAVVNSSASLTTSGANIYIGNSLTGANPYAGSISLLRVGLTAPSEEQIKKIYKDESELFKQNTACTLYGTSNDVRCVAYDDDLNLLHVGTPSGRSTFQGLVRIANTTTAVTAAISASNGMVVEQ